MAASVEKRRTYANLNKPVYAEVLSGPAADVIVRLINVAVAMLRPARGGASLAILLVLVSTARAQDTPADSTLAEVPAAGRPMRAIPAL